MLFKMNANNFICLQRMGVDLLVNAESETVLLRDDSSQVKVPVLAMRGGSDLQTYVDILVPSNAKLTLVKVSYHSNNCLADVQLDFQQGEGPVHLIGSHCIDFFASMDGEADDEEDEDDEMEVGEVCFLPFWV